MSLGLRGGSKLHELFGLLTPYGAGKLKELVKHARAYAKYHHLEAAFRSLKTREGWHISFHPAAQDIVLTLQAGYVVIDARTLEAGPGYHAFVVGFFDDLSRHHQWVWELRNKMRHFADDTSYYHDRNFSALQSVMAGEFAAMCQGLVELEACDRSPQNVWLPQAFDLATDHFAATSLGFRDRAFFEAPQPERFFPWWEEGPTAQAVKNVALSKMWLDDPQEASASANERQDLENCRALIDRARALGVEFAGDEGDTATIGYCRQDTWYVDTGGWSIAVPAFYREEIDADGQLCSLLSDDRAVYIRSYYYDEPETQLKWPEPETEGYSEYLRFKTDQYRVVIEAGEMDEDEDGVRWRVWQGTYNALKGSALISVVSANADDAAWAEKVLRSVQPDREGPMIKLAPIRFGEL